MPTTQYLPFGTGGGANTLSYASYSATAALIASGYSAGLADAQHVNTVLRQLSVAAAGVAKFATDHGTLDCLDNGSVTDFAAALASAVGSYVPASGIAIINTAGLVDGFVLAGTLRVQWKQYTLTDTVTGPGGTTDSIVFPHANSATLAVFASTAGDETTAKVDVRNITITGCDLHTSEWSNYSQNGSAHVLVIGLV